MSSNIVLLVVSAAVARLSETVIIDQRGAVTHDVQYDSSSLRLSHCECNKERHFSLSSVGQPLNAEESSCSPQQVPGLVKAMGISFARGVCGLTECMHIYRELERRAS